jgi:hypothetical protein
LHTPQMTHSHTGPAQKNLHRLGQGPVRHDAQAHTVCPFKTPAPPCMLTSRFSLQYEGTVQGLLVQRYKRFLADVSFPQPGPAPGRSESGIPVASGAAPTTSCSGVAAADEEQAVVVVHCPNTGAMTGLLDR